MITKKKDKVHKKSPKKATFPRTKKNTHFSHITSLTNKTKKKRKESVFPPLALPQKELPLFLSLSLCVVKVV